jgi:2',3'-cyclic-nucleotide 2'-phosphodiesterase (5'-nucleotidase family)
VLDAATAAAAAATAAATTAAIATVSATVSTPLARSAAQPQLLRQQSQLLPQQQQEATPVTVVATSDTHSRTRSAIRRKMDFLLREGLHVSADDSNVTVNHGHAKKRQQQPKEPAADAVAEGLQMYVREYRPLSASARDRGGAVSRGRVRPATAGAARSSAAL